MQRTQLQRITAENDIFDFHKPILKKILAEGVHEELAFEFIPVTVERNSKSGRAFFPPIGRRWMIFMTPRFFKFKNEINGKAVYLVQRAYWPQVLDHRRCILYEFGLSKFGYALQYGQSDSPWNALLTVQYNIWDWGIRRRDVEVAQLTRDVKEYLLTQDFLQTKATISGLMIDLDRIRKSLLLSQELLDAEEQTYRTLETQYREGQVAYLGFSHRIEIIYWMLGSSFTRLYFEALRE